MVLQFEGYRAHPNKLPLASARGNELPYWDEDNEALFIADDDDGAAHQRATSRYASTRANSRIIKCQFAGCEERFVATKMRQHTAWHIPHDPGATVVAPCDLCGVNPQAQFASGNTGCSAWLQKKGKSMKPRHACRTLGDLGYSHAPAMKFSPGAPSTNHLIACPECPAKPMVSFFWKYRAMADHWLHWHPTITMPPALEEALKISEAERAELKKFKVAGGLAKAKKEQRKAKTKAKTKASARKRTIDAAALYIAGEDSDSDAGVGPSASRRRTTILDRELALTMERPNPKKAGGAAFARYERYMVATTVGGYLDLGGSRADLRYDLSKGHAALPEETPIAPTGETPPTAAMTATPTATPATGA